MFHRKSTASIPVHPSIQSTIFGFPIFPCLYREIRIASRWGGGEVTWYAVSSCMDDADDLHLCIRFPSSSLYTIDPVVGLKESISTK